MGYDIGGGYDAWKLSTPWDNEVSISVSFECTECEEWNENDDVTVSRGDDEAYVECFECGKENSVYIGRDE